MRNPTCNLPYFRFIKLTSHANSLGSEPYNCFTLIIFIVGYLCNLKSTTVCLTYFQNRKTALHYFGLFRTLQHFPKAVSQGRCTRGGYGCFNTHTFPSERVQNPNFLCSLAQTPYGSHSSISRPDDWLPHLLVCQIYQSVCFEEGNWSV